jgi:hypothetical protein
VLRSCQNKAVNFTQAGAADNDRHRSLLRSTAAAIVDVSFLHRSGRVEHDVDINAADLPKENQSNETFGYVNNLP